MAELQLEAVGLCFSKKKNSYCWSYYLRYHLCGKNFDWFEVNYFVLVFKYAEGIFFLKRLQFKL